MKIAIAMSGGVDSSVAAKILKDEGHEVVGLFLKLWSDSTCNIAKENRCCDYEALDDARAVAAKLNIPFYVINARDEFKDEVVDYFLREYQSLRTPNPCVVCNDKIKFGLLLKRALEIGCDFLATGHYARIAQSQISNLKSQNYNLKSGKLEARSWKLEAGLDRSKDQSYMLYHLTQRQLSHIMFPLGNMTKKEVRALASKWDLPVKEKPESQEICFFGDKDYRAFLKRYLPEEYFKPGKIVDRDGNVLGEHQGLINYTIGQRKGVEQSSVISNQLSDQKNRKPKTENRKPLYVIGFNVKKNQLVVGKDKDVYSNSMIVTDVNWINPDCHPELAVPAGRQVSGSLAVKIRYRHSVVTCKIKYKKSNIKNIEVLFDEPQRAVTPGQSAVFYGGDLSREAKAKWEEVLGGGIIK